MKVLIAEDHELYSDGLCLMLKDMDSSIEVLKAADFPIALDKAIQHPDLQLVLLDIQLPGTTALEGVALMREQFPFLPIIVVSALDLDANVANIMELGINGFIAKSASKNEIQAGIKSVLAGELVVISQAIERAPVQLSNRQLETLRLIAKGLPNKRISEQLGVSDNTVREYVSEILRQLDADNRVEAVVVARKRGILID